MSRTFASGYTLRQAVGVLVAAVAAAGLAASCQSVPLTAPQGTTITFTAPAAMISTGSIDIVVSVIQGGTSSGSPNTTTPSGLPVHDDTVVSLTTTLGIVHPSEAKTVNGRVHVTLTGDGRTGSAKIVAASGGISGNVTITINSSTVSGVSINLPGATGTVSTPANFTVGVGSSTGVTDVTVNFGDGTVQSLGPFATNTTVTATHLYATTGAFQVVATATASDGGTASNSMTVAIGPLTLTPSGPNTIKVDASGTYTITPTAGALIDRYDWDFGDGTTFSTPGNSQAHVYTSTGTKTIRVTVVPTVGVSQVATMDVVVTPG